MNRISTSVPVVITAGIAFGIAAMAASAAPVRQSHGVEAVPLVTFSDGLETWPLVPPAPVVDDLEVAPLVAPTAPPPLPPKIEIIRWKKAPVRRPKWKNYTPQSQTFNAYVRGTQRARLTWSIDVDAERGRCNFADTEASVAFASTKPVLVTVGRDSFSIPAMPVRFSVGLSYRGVPDRYSCMPARENSEGCTLGGQDIPGEATFTVIGNKVALEGLRATGPVAPTCIGFTGWDGVMMPNSGPVPTTVSKGVLFNRSKQNVYISNAYNLQGSAATAETEGICQNVQEGYACRWSSSTAWNIAMLRAGQVRLPRLR